MTNPKKGDETLLVAALLALPALFVIGRKTVHSVIREAVREGVTLANNDIAVADDMYQPTEEDLGAVAAAGGPNVLNADIFATRCRVGGADEGEV